MTQALLTDFWPEVAENLGRELARRRLDGRGLDRHSVEDLCQQTYVRALEHRGSIGPTFGDLMRWARTVAHRDATRLLRRLARVEAEGLLGDGWLADEPGPMDVEREVEARITLRRVWDAVGELRVADHAAVVGVLQGRSTGRTKREQDTNAMRLSRARQRLRELSGPLGGLGIRPWRWRHVASELHPAIAAGGSALFAAGVAASLAIFLPVAEALPGRAASIVLSSASHNPALSQPVVAADLAAGPAVVAEATATPTAATPTAESAEPSGGEGSTFAHPDAPVLGPVTRDRRAEDQWLCARNLRLSQDVCLADPADRADNPAVSELGEGKSPPPDFSPLS